MKKTMIILVMILLGMNFTSCDQDSVSDDIDQIEQATGGDDEEVDDGRGNG